MPDIDYLALVSRWLHILAAITAVGGTFFSLLALLPALSTLEEKRRDDLQEAIRSRWSKVVQGAIVVLLVTGLYNIVITMTRYKLPPLYHALFGVKFLLAMAIFFLASMLTGRSPAAQRFRSDARRWLRLTAILAVLLVCISGVLKVLPHDKKPASEPPPSANVQPSTSTSPG